MSTKRKYYAEKSPRGFDNEWNFYAFPDKKTREHFVREGNGDITTSEEVRRVMRTGPKGQYNQIIPVEISHVTKRECEMRGGSWVDEYRKSDGTMVKGYCREIEWDSRIDQEYWQQNEWEKRRR
jgi:hypothetical protein